ncbi:TRAP transporter small permease subunit [Mesorhizobium microcysteis]|uniref:TRAP transporter small permease protein n=1 Tax=Neoaquamicrobium microcysteis TaxID=2682781 RepID=A0A5D4HAI4_9HYPH|nr:TRAP transporter small permease subunit [Mesorhizobium microcysteis]TYR37658.1 TRAP transporter small permease subunit [Mesorhizobium microcysteis]
MSPTLLSFGDWLYRRAENVLAAMLATMFGLFLLQVFYRYVLNWPTGWTNELSAILWIWIVLFGAAFVVTEQEEMRFDLIYGSVGPKLRAAMFIACAASIVVLYGASLPATYWPAS